jgi:hypothetical protein
LHIVKRIDGAGSHSKDYAVIARVKRLRLFDSSWRFRHAPIGRAAKPVAVRALNRTVAFRRAFADKAIRAFGTIGIDIAAVDIIVVEVKIDTLASVASLEIAKTFSVEFFVICSVHDQTAFTLAKVAVLAIEQIVV